MRGRICSGCSRWSSSWPNIRGRIARWPNGWRRTTYSPLAAHIADLRLAHSNCATPATISVAELAHELKIADKGPGDFHILDGYDRALALLADGLDIRLGTAVTRFSWAEDGVTIETQERRDDRGRQWRA